MHDRVCRLWVEMVPGQAFMPGVDIENYKGVNYVVYKGLDVKFNITLDASGFVKDGMIGVANLNWETINHYMANIGLVDWKQRRHIRLEAGYASGPESAVGLIFEGRVMKAQPTIAPEMWLNFSVMSDELSSKDTFAISAKGNDWVDSALTQLGAKVGFKYEPKNFKIDPKPGDKTYDGTGDYFYHKVRLENAFNQGKGIRSSIVCNDEGLIVVDSRVQTNDPLKGKYAPGIIYDTFIVGTPNLDWPNMTVTTLLNPTYHCFQKVSLSMIEEATYGRYKEWTEGKDYFINRMTHKGHLRGGTWTTTFHLIDNTDYAKKWAEQIKKSGD